MKLKKILSKLLFREITMPIMVNNTIYSNNVNSYSGGSLVDSNVLFVMNKMLDDDLKMIKKTADKEHFDYSILQSNSISIDNIIEAGSDLLGPFLHIVNVFYYSEEVGAFTVDGLYNDSDILFNLHQTIQQEVDYLSKLKATSYLSIIYIGSNTIESSSFSNNIELMVKGLSRVLGNHCILCNGIIASKEVPIQIIHNAISFINSKYGTVLAGEVLKLK